MSTENIRPDKITKPIQLLAAWLLGLILINTTFLTAASQISRPDWASGMLIISAVVNVPLFLLSLFLLQTKFRPEMQEDTYYSQYLKRKYDETISTKSDKRSVEDEEKETKATAELITKELVNAQPAEKAEKIQSILRIRDKGRVEKRIGESRGLSQLFMYPEKWTLLLEKWKNDPNFIRDIDELIYYKVAEGDFNNLSAIKLTPFGQDIAKKLFDEKKLWNQTHDRVIE